MADLNELYDRKKKYEDLRPTLVTCKDQLARANGWLDDVLSNMPNTLKIDKKGYGEEIFKTQKKNIEKQVKSVENAIIKLDKNYKNVCAEIEREEERRRREQEAAAAARRAASSPPKSTGSGSGKSSGGSSNSGKSSGGKSGGNKSGGGNKKGLK